MESIEIIDNLRAENEKLHNQLMETEKDAQERIEELEAELKALKSKENLCEHEEIPFADEQYEEDLLAELQDRHQQDCITINQLNVTIDVLVDKLSRLRQQIGL